MRIKDLQLINQPLEKILRYGASRLTNDELLAIIIGSGTHEMNAVVLSQLINKKIKTNSFDELKNIRGLGKMKIARILAAIELGKRKQQQKIFNLILQPKDIWSSLIDVRDSKKEYFVVFYLDVQNRIIKKEIISVGTLNAGIVHPREVYEPAVKYLAASIIISHNHPSGDCWPSKEDVKLTRQLIKAGKILGIDLVDHVIVSQSSFFSFKEHKIF